MKLCYVALVKEESTVSEDGKEESNKEEMGFVSLPMCSNSFFSYATIIGLFSVGT